MSASHAPLTIYSKTRSPCNPSAGWRLIAAMGVGTDVITGSACNPSAGWRRIAASRMLDHNAQCRSFNPSAGWRLIAAILVRLVYHDSITCNLLSQQDGD